VRGCKHFVLLPPVESACINEQLIPAATYTPRPPLSTLSSSLTSSHSYPPSPANTEVTLSEALNDLVVCLDEPEENVPFATWDPDLPDRRPTPFSKCSRLLRVTLEEGDMLYLPALW
jgi:peptidyl-lysine (3S)-dioxygenase / protease